MSLHPTLFRTMPPLVLLTITLLAGCKEYFVERVGKQGRYVATVMQHPKLMARTAAEYADLYIRNGRRGFQPKMPVSVDLVTVENIGKFTAYGKTE